jgi:hypothetical protein
MKTIFISCLGVLMFFSCKKNIERCWQVYDGMGNEMGIVCGKTETEIQNLYGPFYDIPNAPKFCWKVTYAGGVIAYPENLTQKLVNIWHGPNAVMIEKIECGYCQRWLTREKWMKKSSGTFAYTPVQSQQYCGDTTATIFAGRIITLRETTDSVFYHEFIQKI